MMLRLLLLLCAPTQHSRRAAGSAWHVVSSVTHVRGRRGCAATAVGQCAATDNSADCGALLDMWTAWGNVPTFWFTQVNSVTSMCSWTGIVCSGGRVALLCVPHPHPHPLPTAHVQVYSVLPRHHACRFTPGGIQRRECNGCGLSGTIPSSLGNMTALTTLCVRAAAGPPGLKASSVASPV